VTTTASGYEADATKTRQQILHEVIGYCRSLAFKQAEKCGHAVETDELAGCALLGVALADSQYGAYCQRNNFDRGFSLITGCI
jgi:hypothetical protein